MTAGPDPAPGAVVRRGHSSGNWCARDSALAPFKPWQTTASQGLYRAVIKCTGKATGNLVRVKDAKNGGKKKTVLG